MSRRRPGRGRGPVVVCFVCERHVLGPSVVFGINGDQAGVERGVLLAHAGECADVLLDGLLGMGCSLDAMRSYEAGDVERFLDGGAA